MASAHLQPGVRPPREAPLPSRAPSVWIRAEMHTAWGAAWSRDSHNSILWADLGRSGEGLRGAQGSELESLCPLFPCQPLAAPSGAASPHRPLRLSALQGSGIAHTSCGRRCGFPEAGVPAAQCPRNKRRAGLSQSPRPRHKHLNTARGELPPFGRSGKWGPRGWCL